MEKIITINADNIKVNIIKNPKESTPERDIELLANYVDAVKEIYDSLDKK